MQQIYRRTPMLKCDFNKAALQLYSNNTSAWVFSCKFAAYFQSTFSKEHLWVTTSGLYGRIKIAEELKLPPSQKYFKVTDSNPQFSSLAIHHSLQIHTEYFCKICIGR